MSYARTTGPDKDQQFHVQQAVQNGKLGDYNVLSPYGLYANLPSDSYGFCVSDTAMIPFNEGRPEIKQGEVILFNPAAGGTVHLLADGSVNIASASAIEIVSPSFSVTSENVTIEALSSLVITAANIVLNGPVTINGDVQINGMLNGHPP